MITLDTLGVSVRDMNELISRYDEISESIISDCNANGLEKLDSGEYHVLAPVPVPMQDVICLGVNYKEHIEETSHALRANIIPKKGLRLHK